MHSFITISSDAVERPGPLTKAPGDLLHWPNMAIGPVRPKINTVREAEMEPSGWDMAGGGENDITQYTRQSGRRVAGWSRWAVPGLTTFSTILASITRAALRKRLKFSCRSCWHHLWNVYHISLAVRASSADFQHHLQPKKKRKEKDQLSAYARSGVGCVTLTSFICEIVFSHFSFWLWIIPPVFHSALRGKQAVRLRCSPSRVTSWVIP